MSNKVKIRESDMYEPVKDFFTGRGYSVSAEVKDCDIVAVKDDSIVVVEMKTAFNLKLIYQGLDRLKISQDVYLCIPRPSSMMKASNKNMLNLIKKLGLGLMTVATDSPLRTVAILCIPGSEKKDKINAGRRNKVLKEITMRTKDVNIGGSKGIKLCTAFREKSIKIACIMERNGGVSAAELSHKYDCEQDAYRIIYSNYYGWFEKTADKGVYTLSKAGFAFLNGEEFREIIEYYRNIYKG